MKNTQIIILAAGRGTRMGGEAKALVPLAGKAFLTRILENIKKLPLSLKPIVVVGYEKDKVIQCINGQCEYAEQTEQLGTGHAVLSARAKAVHPHDTVVVLYTDQPLTSAETIERMAKAREASGAKIVMATTKIPNFDDWHRSFLQWGRIKRNDKKEIIGIVEYKDATDEEKNITEVNPSYFAFDAKWLWENLEKIGNDNAKREYYLTDLVKIAFEEGHKIETIEIPPEETLGANTLEELAILEKFAPRE